MLSISSFGWLIVLSIFAFLLRRVERNSINVKIIVVHNNTIDFDKGEDLGKLAWKGGKDSQG